ncbi:MAG: hypothetical protein C0609_12075 [Deltaproteobacteria bacterium]|nr:MAG: hypothetical protein C0609_12075 [Deltaproteobacteria bacterium]
MINVDSIEKRAHRRASEQIIGQIRTNGSNNGYYVTNNISSGGAYFNSINYSPEENSLLSIVFSCQGKGLKVTKNGKEFYGWVTATVVRRSGKGFAVKFLDNSFFDITRAPLSQEEKH